MEEYIKRHGNEIISEADTIVHEVDLNEQSAEMVVNLAKKYNKNIPLDQSAAFVVAMKDVLLVCARPYNEDFPTRTCEFR